MMCKTLSIGVCCNCVNEAFSSGISMDMTSPQFFLINLADQVARQRAYKLNLARRFVVRQRLTTKGFEGLGIDFFARHNESLDLLAHTLRWNTDHRRFDHRRMAIEHLFNVTRVDVESTANNQVFFALDDVQVAVFIEAAHIAGMQPAIAQGRLCLFGHVVVALHDIRPARDDLAHLAGGNGLIIVIHDAYLNTIDRLAHGTRLAQHIYTVAGEDGTRLGQPVTFQDAAAIFLLEGLQNSQGQWGRAAHTILQAASIIFAGVRRVEQSHVHGRYASEAPDAVAFDGRKYGACVKARVHDDGSAA